VNPSGGKIARAAAVSPLIEAGNVYLPHPAYAPWVNDFIEECAAFPNGAHDDQVDAMTQALIRWNVVPEQTVVYYSPRVQISRY
jgi:predicted phage terminase large subunit-like protein